MTEPAIVVLSTHGLHRQWTTTVLEERFPYIYTEMGRFHSTTRRAQGPYCPIMTLVRLSDEDFTRRLELAREGGEYWRIDAGSPLIRASLDRGEVPE